MAKINRNIDNIRHAYIEQLDHLVKECIEFDKGDTYQIKIISTSLRKILKDSRSCSSLLTQLQIKNNIKFIDTSIPRDSFSFWNIQACSDMHIVVHDVYGALLQKHISFDKGKYHYYFSPLLDRNNNNAKWVDFDSWYNAIIYNDGAHSLTRKSLLEIIAEQDGGAHYDTKIESEYIAFSEKTSLKVVINNKNVSFDNNPAYISLRQMAYEVLYSLSLYESSNKQ